MGKNDDHRFRVLAHRNGREYIFNYQKFKSIWDNLPSYGGEKTKIINLVFQNSDNGISGNSTFYAWVQNKNGPRNLVILHALEKALNLEEDSLLMEKNYESNKKEKGKMREISENERNVARELYMKMCDLLELAESLPEYTDKNMMVFRASRCVSAPNDMGNTDRTIDDERFEFERYIRKARFDVPQKLCTELIQIVNDIYGPVLYEAPTEMFFNSPDYKEYKRSNNITDETEARYVYSAVFVAGIRERLELLFKDYFVD